MEPLNARLPATMESAVLLPTHLLTHGSTAQPRIAQPLRAQLQEQGLVLSSAVAGVTEYTCMYEGMAGGKQGLQYL